MKWYVGAVVVLLVALVFDLGLLAYAMYVLLGVMLVSRFLARSGIENLSTKRSCDRETARVGESAEVVVTVRNHGWLPVPWVLIEDLVPKQALAQRPPRIRVGKGKRLKISLLWSRGRTRMKYRLDFAMRGYYQIGPAVLETGDVFGLHRRYRVVTEPSFILVYPRVVPLEGYDLASRRPIGEIRLVHRLYEDPTRIAGVRCYQPGDALSRVHWRATARTGVLHSKVYEPSTLAGATILLDLHEGGYHRRGEPFRSELAVTTAASVAHALFELGQQVGLITNGRDAAARIRAQGWDHEFRTRQAARTIAGVRAKDDRLQPIVVETRRGPEQFMRILETLARVELTDGLTFAQLVAETSSRLPRDATVVAVIAEASAETVLTLSMLRQRGYAVTANMVIIEEHQRLDTRGLLIAEGIEVRHVRDEASIAAACRKLVLR